MGENYATSVGRNVFATAVGVVSEVGSRSDLGTYITIEHTLGDGTKIHSVYGHLSRTLFTVGQRVSSDTKIAVIGNTGNDYMLGGSSNDKLYGQEGNDTLIGGKGNDILDGGPGSDIAFSDPGDTLVGIEG
ncbi:MAG: peptidoglycan DD-metalloendopeptidase family protein [Gemmatimonadaceae bacterium]